MTITLTPTTPLRFLLSRLRQGIADMNRFDDADVLAFLNDGYIELCEMSRYRKTLVSFAIIADQQEYTLPVDCCEVLRLYIAGTRQIPVSLDEAQGELAGPYYYQYATIIGFTETPVGSGTGWLYYAQRPAALTLDETPLIPPEYYHYLRHYAAWRCMTLQSGAAAISEAQQQRSLFDEGVIALRGENIKETTPHRLQNSAGVGFTSRRIFA